MAYYVFCFQEYAKLHERYTELFKTHMDYMERTKLLLSTASDRSEVRGRLGLNPVGRSTGEYVIVAFRIPPKVARWKICPLCKEYIPTVVLHI